MTDDFLQPQSPEQFVALYVQHQVAIRRAYGPSGKEIGKVAIPQRQRHEHFLRGMDGCMMYVTTNKALYAGRLEERK